MKGRWHGCSGHQRRSPRWKPSDHHWRCPGGKSVCLSQQHTRCLKGGLGVGFEYLSAKVGAAALRDLKDDGGFLGLRSFKRSNCGGGRRDIDGRDGKLVVPSVLEEGQDIISDDYTLLAAQNIGDTHSCD